MWRLTLAMRMAWRSLSAHRLRTGLAVLGIVIGVGAVIMLTAMGQGAQRSVSSRVSNLGVNLMFVSPSREQAAHGVARRTAETLTIEDAREVGKLPGVIHAVPDIGLRAVKVAYGSKDEDVDRVIGTWPEYQVLRNYPVASGRFFDDADVLTSRRVCVLGSAIARKLFGWNEPLDKWVRIGRQSFKVVGVMAERGAESAWLRFDEYVYVPITSLQKFLETTRRHLDQVIVRLKDESVVESVRGEVTALLMRRHGIPHGETPDFEISSQAQLQETMRGVTEAFTTLLVGIAVVSLLVGGIGIMNVMIVTVMERTREIGIRKALGARRGDILNQFVLESFLISFVGGVLGIGLGVVGAKLLPLLSVWQELSRGRGAWEAYISVPHVLLAFSFACAVGLFFGIYPAWRASRLNPVEALRYE